jgi:hypothetical protein
MRFHSVLKSLLSFLRIQIFAALDFSPSLFLLISGEVSDNFH